MAYSEKTAADLSLALTSFRAGLPDDQRSALDDIMRIALKAAQDPKPVSTFDPATNPSILSSGATDELAKRAREQEPLAIEAGTTITVTTVTTSLQSSRLLC